MWEAYLYALHISAFSDTLPQKVFSNINVLINAFNYCCFAVVKTKLWHVFQLRAQVTQDSYIPTFSPTLSQTLSRRINVDS